MNEDLQGRTCWCVCVDLVRSLHVAAGGGTVLCCAILRFDNMEDSFCL